MLAERAFGNGYVLRGMFPLRQIPVSKDGRDGLRGTDVCDGTHAAQKRAGRSFFFFCRGCGADRGKQRTGPFPDGRSNLPAAGVPSSGGDRGSRAGGQYLGGRGKENSESLHLPGAGNERDFFIKLNA